jgi:dTMP kinase
LKTGHFISFEGPEGSGKSTNIHFVETLLKERGVECRLTREPGGTKLGEKIRELLLNKDFNNMAADTELLLMFAARAQHVEEVIKPALAAGQWVLCDRFTDASFAYQGGGRQISMQRISTLAHWTLGDFKPDVTFLLDVPVDVGMARARQRGSLDRFEQEHMDFFERVRQNYLEQAENDTGRYRVIDASVDLDAVQAQLETQLLNYFENHG